MKTPNWLKWIGRCFVTSAAIFMLAGLSLTNELHRSVPDYAAAFETSSLDGDLQIIRDLHNVPHIKGTTDLSVYYGLGVTHAQDRLWQMMMTRQIVSGRLAEWFGGPAARFDRLILTLGLADAARASFETYDPDVKAAFKAYADGVNDTLRARGRKLPPEFVLLGIRPEPWTPSDSAAGLKMLALSLSGNAFMEIARAGLSATLTPDQIDFVFPALPGQNRPALPDFNKLINNETDLSGLLDLIEVADLPYVEASNNWVIAGARSETGKPLLANDPHLGFSAPSVWYLAHLAFPEMNVVGGTIPGIPTVLIGQNGHIAWGMTNTGPDTQDLYVEQLHPTDPGQYQTPQGYAAIEESTHHIKVRFGRDQTIEVGKTRHGPIFDVARDFPDLNITAKGQVLSLAWPGLSHEDRTGHAAIRAIWARNWSEFNEALRDFHSPMQSMVYADTQGHIGLLAASTVPIRRPEHQTHGLLPAPGWNSVNDWTGSIPFEGLPRRLDPEEGLIVTANQKIVGDDYPYVLTNDWSFDFRARRIETLIRARAKHSLQSLADIQIDNTSKFALEVLPLLTGTAMRDQRAETMRQTLITWDGHLKAEDWRSTLFHQWLNEFAYLFYVPTLERDANRFRKGNPIALLSALRSDPVAQEWCRNGKTKSPVPCADLVEPALINALETLETTYGPAPDQWAWGPIHESVHEHTPFSSVPGLSKYFTIKAETGGGPYSPNQGNFSGNGAKPFQNRHGAGYRAVYDLSDLDRSIYIQSTGQSGHPFSDDYRHFVDFWKNGKFINISTDWEIILTNQSDYWRSGTTSALDQ